MSFLSFSEFIELDEATNTHSTHAEDAFILNGPNDIQPIIDTLVSIVTNLKSRKAPPVSVKIDGAPALFVSYTNGKFFIATKSLFNKEPKINFTTSDIDKNHPGGLGETLKVFLKYLPKVIPDDGKLYQGDVLFTNSTLHRKVIDGVESFTWQPNTILYSVPVNSEIGNKIRTAKCGICFHTRYTWDGLDTKTLSVLDFNVRKEMFKNTSEVYITDPYVMDISKEVFLNPAQEERLKKNIASIKSLSSKINYAKIQDPKINPLLMIYINTFYKGNTVGADNEKARGFSTWLKARMDKEVGEKKTQKGKDGVIAKYEPLMKDDWSKILLPVFQMHTILNDSKLIVKSLLDKISVSKNFYVKSDGTLVAAGNEGYVVTTGDVKGIKLVNRGEFSSVNFSSDFLKGFMR